MDLAKAVECTPSHLTNVEAGRREASAKLIKALARELRVPLLSLLGPEVRPEEDEGAPPQPPLPQPPLPQPPLSPIAPPTPPADP